MAALLAVAALPCLAQTVTLPSELAFLTTYGQPYRVTYEPWAEIQMPGDPWGDNGVGRLERGKHWQFPVIVPGAKDGDAVWAIMKTGIPEEWMDHGAGMDRGRPAVVDALQQRQRGGLGVAGYGRPRARGSGHGRNRSPARYAHAGGSGGHAGSHHSRQG